MHGQRGRAGRAARADAYCHSHDPDADRDADANVDRHARADRDPHSRADAHGHGCSDCNRDGRGVADSDGHACPACPAPATPTPVPSLDEVIEPAPGAFEHRTFEHGERIEWPNGVLFMDPATGRVEGYRIAGEWVEAGAAERDGVAPVEWSYRAHGPSNRWVTAGGWPAEASLLLDRELERAWLLAPGPQLWAVSRDGALLWVDSGVAILTDEALTERARFEWAGGGPLFSPDGGRLAWRRGEALYVTDLRTLESTLLFEATPHERWGAPRVSDAPGGTGEEILVTLWYSAPEEADYRMRLREWVRLGWGGEERSRVASNESMPWVTHAPDGRHLAWQDGDYVFHPLDGGFVWPSVVVADARTGDVLFRVRSAALQLSADDTSSWLPSGDGLLLRTSPDGWCGLARAMLLRIRPEPAIEVLPASDEGCPAWPFKEGAIAPRTADIRFIAENHNDWTGPTREQIVAVYDPAQFLWRNAVLVADSKSGCHDYLYLRPEWPPPGDPHPELRLTFACGKFTDSEAYLFAQPKIEFPPFDDELAFRVARTGSCLRLREAPRDTSLVLDCLPDGTRVVVAGTRKTPDGGLLASVAIDIFTGARVPRSRLTARASHHEWVSRLTLPPSLRRASRTLDPVRSGGCDDGGCSARYERGGRAARPRVGGDRAVRP